MSEVIDHVGVRVSDLPASRRMYEAALAELGFVVLSEGEFEGDAYVLFGRAQIDEDEVAGGKRVAVRLVCVDPPHPDPQKPDSLFAQRWPLRCLPVHEVEKVVGHPRSVAWTLQNLACAPEEGHRSVGECPLT